MCNCDCYACLSCDPEQPYEPNADVTPLAPVSFEQALHNLRYSFPPFTTPREEIPPALRARA